MIHKARISKLFVRMFACLFFVFGGVCAANASVYIETLAMPANSAFTFTLSAKGAFRVDCGADGTLGGVGVSGDLIDRTSISTNDTYSCKYSSAGKRKIKIDGTATGYSTEAGFVPVISFASSCANIRLVDGDLSVMFPILANISIPRYISTFEGCSNITSIPDTLFSSYTLTGQYMFWNTFKNCTGLGTSTDPNEVALPAGLFSGITGFITGIPQAGFYYTFEGCTNLKEIPENLFLGIRNNTQGANHTFAGTFSGCSSLTTIPANLFAFASNISGKQSMFYETFKGCSSLTTIPDGLFRTFSTAGIRMFQRTFANCTSLSSIPDGLFSWVTTATEGLFSNTFSGCTGLSGYVSPKLFKGLTQNGAPNANDFMTNTFYNTGLATSCPSGTGQYKTGYESSWSGKVSCTTFSTETTSLAANSTFAFTLSAQGTFDVYCGVGGTLSGTGVSGNTITRSGTTNDTYTCTYSNAGTKTVGINGTATGYSSGNTIPAISFNIDGSDSDANVKKIAAISGSLGQIFGTVANPSVGSGQPRFYQTFSGASNMTGTNIPDPNNTGMNYALPPKLFDGISGAPAEWMFAKTFYKCGGLTGSIPSGLFGSLSGAPASRMFFATFQNCNGLTGSIPSGLFGSLSGAPASSMFDFTFAYCVGLTGSIPSGLFGNLSGAPAESMFAYTFYSCSGLTGSIPSGLFGNLFGAPANYMFRYTFNSCSNLSGFGDKTYVPGDFLANINTNTSVLYQTTDMFSGTQLVNPCPANTYAVTREQFNDAGKPWCSPCPTGTISPAGSTSVSQCVVVYNITYYDSDCSTELTGLTPTTYTVNDTVALPIPTMTGYTFGNGWCSSCGSNCGFQGWQAGVRTGNQSVYMKSNAWVPNIYTITLRNYNNSDSTIYEKYNTGWYSNSAATTSINAAPIPTRSGYTFRGFYAASQPDLTATGGSGTPVIDTSGTLPENNAYTADTILYGAWARNCNPGAGCTCNLVMNNDGTVTYQTGVDTGYTLTGGSGTYAPVCSGNSIALTWDEDANMTPMSCTYGSTFTPATPANRTGYVFMGWKKRSCLYNQDTSINSTAQSYYSITNTCCINTACGSGYCSNTNFNDLSTGDWKVFFDYGTIYGTSMCSETSGTLKAVGNPSSTSGSYCWCAVTRFVSSDQTQQCNAANLIWVLKGNVNNCGNNCAYGCASFTKLQSDFRAALYGQTQ